MIISSARQRLWQVFLQAGNKLVRYVYRFLTEDSYIATLIVAGLTFLLILSYSVPRVEYPFYHDSFYYWQLANAFEGSNFSFVNYSNELRGYLFPFLLFILKKQADLINIDAKLLFHVYSALFFSALTIYIIPWFFSSIFHKKALLWRRLLIALLLFIFWRGHFLYPLSDFPALALLLIGFTLISISTKKEKVPLWTIGIGLFLGAALNIRPVYQISILVIVPLFLIHSYKTGLARAASWVSLVLLGFGIIVLPQFLVNRAHFNANSPWVLARVAEDENLYVKQLFWGLGTQKIETHIGDHEAPVLVAYNDPFKFNLQKTNLLREKTFNRYIEIMRRFPVEMAVSYFRHLFNGLDIFFPTPYVKNVFASHTLLSFFNYLVWFLVILHLLKTDLSQLDSISALGVVGLLAPVVLAIPTAVEVRFFLPASILAYGVVAFGIEYPALVKTSLKNKWEVFRFVVICMFWIILCFTLSKATIENIVL